MNDITREQAALITDLESYKTVTGAKRLKRTKEEMEAGLTPEEALRNRLLEARGEAVEPRQTVEPIKATVSRKGDITIHIRPAAKTDADYFEHVPDKPVTIILEQNWYSWFDTLANGAFEKNTTKLLKYILDQGMGEVLTKFHFPSDIAEFERPIK